MSPLPSPLLVLPHRYLKCDLLQYNLTNLGSKFDVICIDPPLEEYTRRYSGFQFHQHMWDFEEVGILWVGGGGIDSMCVIV